MVAVLEVEAVLVMAVVVVAPWEVAEPEWFGNSFCVCKTFCEKKITFQTDICTNFT